MKNKNLSFGIGEAKHLSLRVSVGVLVKALFINPENKKTTMLALERTASLRQVNGKREIIVKAKPFGGAIRIINPETLKSRIGEFHYDSERSRREGDFRILVHPESWGKIKAVCTDMNELEKGFLDTSPDRELAEEFKDTLNIEINRSQYGLKAQGIVVEDSPCKTANVNARGMPTVRIYYIFEALINSHGIIELMINSSSRYSDEDLEKMALEDERQGGKGRANAILAVSLDDLKEFYHSVPAAGKLNESVLFKEHHIDGNVIAVLEDIPHPRYKRFN